MIRCHRLVDLEVSRGGAILPASQGVNDCRAAQWTRSLPVKPQTQALLAEHVLHKNIMYMHMFHFDDREVGNGQLASL